MNVIAENQAKQLFEIVRNITNKKDSNSNINADLANLIQQVEKMKSPTDSNVNISDLKTYNQILSVLHAGLGTGFGLYFNNLNKKYKDQPAMGIDTVYRSHQESYSLENNNLVQSWSSVPVESPTINAVQQLISLFFYITSGFHAYYAANVNGQYEKLIQNKNNWVRWIEYSITSTIMLYIIAILSGVKDENVYQSIFAINIAMIHTGQLVEEYANENVVFLGKTVPKWTIPMVLGFVLLLTEFNIIIKNFNKRIGTLDNFLKANKDDPFFKDFQFPNWIKYTIFSLFAFFSSFGFISLYGVTTKQSYERTEKLYLLFSALSKATLGSFVAYGLGRRQNPELNQNEPAKPLDEPAKPLDEKSTTTKPSKSKPSKAKSFAAKPC